MNKDEQTEVMDSKLSRRTVVTTGAKLAYGAPLIAASFKISGRNASATGNHDDDDDVCDCVDDSRSPKPGKLVNGDEDLCYVCKGVVPGTTVCGQIVKNGSIQAKWGHNGPVCACNSNSCKVDGKWIDRGTVIQCTPQVTDCGGNTQSLV